MHDKVVEKQQDRVTYYVLKIVTPPAGIFLFSRPTRDSKQTYVLDLDIEVEFLAILILRRSSKRSSLFSEKRWLPAFMKNFRPGDWGCAYYAHVTMH